MITPANDRDLPSTPSAADAPATSTGTSVIDLREGPTTRVRVARDDNPFSAMAPAERMRLIIRVLCELVAYDELDAATATEHRRTLQATVTEQADRTRPTSITG